MKHYTYRAEWNDEDDVYVARCLEFPSLSAHGKTAVKALQELEGVVSDVVKDLQKNKEPVPEPLTEKKYSGSFRVRLPRELHRSLAMESAEQDTSLNQLIVSRLSGGK